MTTQHIQLRAQTNGDITKKTFLGTEYTVVPVVAMVEGVRFGMSQTVPELGLADDFGKFPSGWNNRPVVMNHPDIDGTLVSANSPDVLETFSFGFTANATVDDGKLKLEAWINPQRTEAIGGDAPDVITRLNADEIIEVSVGFFCDVNEHSGTFKGQAYKGIWKNIVPDHLAFLSKGTIGACSVEAGCGTPRTQQAETQMTLQTSGTIVVPKEEVTTQCGCHTDPVVQLKNLEDHIVGLTNKALIGLGALMDVDIRKMLGSAIGEKYGYAYLIGFTSDKAIYERYNSDSSSYETYQVGYSISGVTVSLGEPSEVTLIMTIVPEGETTMTTQAEIVPASTTVVPEPPITPAQTVEPVAPVAQARPLTAQEYIEAAPSEVREMLQAGMKMHADKKAEIIRDLKATKRCKFSDAALNAMSVGDLESLASLAAVPDYSGRTAPTLTPVAQAAPEQYVTAPKIFAVKAAS